MDENKKENNNMLGLDLGGGGLTPTGPTEISNAEGTVLSIKYKYESENDAILDIALHLYYNAYQKDDSEAPIIAVNCLNRAKTFVEIAKNNGIIKF